MSEYADLLSIVLLPHAQTGLDAEDPHLTLVYAGTFDSVHPSVPKALAQDAAMLAQLTQPFVGLVVGTEMFGDRYQPVLLVEAPEITHLQSLVEQYNQSEHTLYRPHVAVRALPFPDQVPHSILFNRIAAWLGDNHVAWRLGTGERCAG